MIAIDTNVLLRLLVQDHQEQYQKARTLLAEHAPVFVTHNSVMETVWVLLKHYKKEKK